MPVLDDINARLRAESALSAVPAIGFRACKPEQELAAGAGRAATWVSGSAGRSGPRSSS